MCFVKINWSYFIIVFGTSIWLHGFPNGIWGFLCFYIFVGMALGIPFEVSHNHMNVLESNVCDEKLEKNNMDQWIKKQIEASVSWNTVFGFGCM